MAKVQMAQGKTVQRNTLRQGPDGAVKNRPQKSGGRPGWEAPIKPEKSKY